MTARKREPLHQPRTAMGKFMANQFIPKYANKVMGMVYLGAAILIIIVGLRGLGTLAGTVGLIPSFLIGADNKIDPFWVMLALLLEFGMLLLLGLVTFYTPSEYIDILHTDKEDDEFKSSAKDLKNELRDLKDYANEELRVIEDYVEKFESLSQKVRDIQLSSIEAISKMKETIGKKK